MVVRVDRSLNFEGEGESGLAVEGMVGVSEVSR